jgi:PAS domain S-box-containing protein
LRVEGIGLAAEQAGIGRRGHGLAAIGVGCTVFVLALVNLQFTREVGRIASVWAPNAVVLAVLLRAPRPRWRLYLAAGYVGNFAANLTVGDSLAVAVALAACNSLETLLCAALIRRLIEGAVDLTRKKDLLLFLLVGGVVGPTTAALGASAILAVSRQASFLGSVVSWWAPDALGLLTITPALLALTGEALSDLAGSLRTGRRGLSVVVLALSLVIAFGQDRYPVVFLVPPALILVAFELNLAGTALALLVTAAVTVAMTVGGHGPTMLMHTGLSTRLAVAQAFLVTMTISVLPVASALSRRSRLESELREANRFSSLAQELAGIGYWRRDLGGGGSLWSEETYRLFGLPADFDLTSGDELQLFAPEDQARIRTTVQHARETGEPYDLKVRLRRADDGRERIIALKGEVERTAAGKAVAIFGVMRDLTEEEASRRQLEESEARYRQLTDSSTDVVLKVDSEDVVEYVSPSVARYGYRPEDLIGVSGYTLVHPDDLPLLRSIIRELFEAGVADRSVDRTHRLRTASGDYVWMEGNPSIIRDDTGRPVSVVSQLRDVSDRVAADAALADSELRYRIIAENVTDVVSRARPDGRFTYLSPSVVNVLGYEPEALIGRDITPDIHPDDVDRVASHWRGITGPTSVERSTLQFRGRHKDGRWIWLESNPTVVRQADGTPIEIVDVIRDVSARVALEAELLAARDAAVAAARAKTEFLANMSHEIRTPLTGVIGFSRLLQEEPLSDNANRYAQRILTAGETLLAVVNDILDFSKLEAAQIELDPHGFDPRAFVAETVELVAELASGKGLSLSVEIDEDTPGFVHADSARLRQVLLNLLTNAIKFTASGGVEVRVGYARGEPGRLRVSVSDTGVGIPDALRHRLFQRFSQIDASISREHGGTGLGLAICKSLVELMGGRIGVETRPGGGSTFWFTIEAPQTARAETVEAETAVEADSEPARILIVDDTEANRDLVRTMLQALGHDCREAGGGAEAVAMAMRERFDLILMDMQMPGMDGVAATRAIREACDLNRSTPIVALTANVLPAQIAICRQAGMDDHIAKPVTPRDLIFKVAQWVAASRSEGERAAPTPAEALL